jgi:DNA-binding NarL/FixJ family response regulator
MTPVRLLVADDHPVFRFGLRALVQAEAELELVGEAATGREAIALAEQLRPDVILLDLNMPGLNGIEVARQLQGLGLPLGILVLTMLEDDDSIFAAMRAGARGYVLKGAGREETLQAIRTVAAGGAIFSPGVAERLLRYFASSQPGLAGTARPEPFPELSEREGEVLELIAAGLTNAAIAERLSLSLKTVRNHVSAVLGKLQVVTRTEAIVRAREAGLGAPAPGPPASGPGRSGLVPTWPDAATGASGHEAQPVRRTVDKAGLLTARERQVAGLLGQGGSNRQIAEALVISERTVEAHIASLLAKTGLSSRVQLALWAAEQGRADEASG